MEIKNTKISFCRLLLFILMVGLTYACKKDGASDLDYTRPVVEAYLLPGKAVQVKIYYQKYLDDTISYGFPITDLKLKISDGNQMIELTETSKGVYTYNDLAFVAEKKTYSLSFDYNGKIISATTTMPDKPTGFIASDSLQLVPEFSFDTTPQAFKPVTLNWDDPGSSYYMMVLKNIETSRTSINPRNNSSYRDTELVLGQVATYQTQQMMFNYLGRYQIILFRVNKEYSDALNNNGGSSLNLTSPYTNVNNGLGIFTAMQSDTLSIRVYQ